jgi:hypothetical protein
MHIFADEFFLSTMLVFSFKCVFGTSNLRKHGPDNSMDMTNWS